jgi:hypothetical protein
MTLTDQPIDRAAERADMRIPRAWLAAGEAECECPDRCPIQHDDNS